MKINCKEIKENIYKKLQKENNRNVSLLIITCDNGNKSSESYIRSKAKACETLGVTLTVEKVTLEDGPDGITNLIQNNKDKTGIIVQLPLFKEWNGLEDYIVSEIPREQDVDGFGIDPLVNSATCNAVFKIIDQEIEDIREKTVMLIGKGKTSGRYIANELIDRGATTIVCNSKTPVSFIHKTEADIIIAAANVPLKDTMLFSAKEGSLDKKELCIDVGIFREEGKLRGCFTEEAKGMNLVSEEFFSEEMKYTSVPGGVGVLTVACLMENLFELAEYRRMNSIEININSELSNSNDMLEVVEEIKKIKLTTILEKMNLENHEDKNRIIDFLEVCVDEELPEREEDMEFITPIIPILKKDDLDRLLEFCFVEKISIILEDTEHKVIFTKNIKENTTVLYNINN